MKLHYFPGFDGRWNFGDVLNPWLWDRVLPGVLDDDESAVFVGIGTLLNEHVPAARHTVVMGSGAGYGELPEHASDWTVYCVRGPLTADRLGLDGTRATTDPGALAARIWSEGRPRDKRRACAYMPHIANANALLEGVCSELGLHYIDPTWSIDRVFEAIATTEVLVTEALHGAICADALRVPWVPIRSADSVFEFKWQDWLGSLGLTYAPHRVLRPLQMTGRRGPHAGLVRWLSCRANRSSLSREIERATPVLSDETVLDDRLSALERSLDELRRDVAGGKFA